MHYKHAAISSRSLLPLISYPERIRTSDALAVRGAEIHNNKTRRVSYRLQVFIAKKIIRKWDKQNHPRLNCVLSCESDSYRLHQRHWRQYGSHSKLEVSISLAAFSVAVVELLFFSWTCSQILYGITKLSRALVQMHKFWLFFKSELCPSWSTVIAYSDPRLCWPGSAVCVAGRSYYFSCEKWFSVDEEDGRIEREVTVLEGGLGFYKVTGSGCTNGWRMPVLEVGWTGTTWWCVYLCTCVCVKAS